MPVHSAASETYQALFKKCLVTRASVERFEAFTRKMFSRTPLSPITIARELVSPQLSRIMDPLQLQYIQRLVETNFLALGEVLIATLRPLGDEEADGEEGEGGEEAAGDPARETVEAAILLMLANTIRFQKPKNPENIWTALAAMGRWMVECTPQPAVTAGNKHSAAMRNRKKRKRRGVQCREAVAEVVAALGLNFGVQKVWAGMIGGGAKSHDVRAAFTEALEAFRRALREEGSMVAGRLDGIFLYQRPGGATGADVNVRGGTSGGGDNSSMNASGNGDLNGKDPSPTVWARSSGVIWISSLLASRPLTDDDESLLSYLSSRYKDDTETLVTEFILASFDTLATCLNANNTSTTFLVRSFIVNKLPLILARIYIQQDILNNILSQVLLKIDPVVMIPGASNDMYSLPGDIRQEFLFAMALHGMVEESAIQGIIGELPMMTLPAAGRYTPEDLVSQCQLEPVERIDRLLEELEALDGNAGAVAVAVVEVMRNMCELKETMSLKTICSALTRKPSSIDVILLFVKPAYLLEPLCVLLDTWRYEEDQGEYHPVYEEFGYILLLVLATIHRYNLPLTPSILGASSDAVDSFIPRLLTKGMTAQRIEELESSDRHAQLGGWIKEIFEAEGISDGLMSSCRPQDFYMLVPTLFLQSVLAAGRGVLDVETLKEGFVYLLEPFLMPSLVGALTWVGNYLWEKSGAVCGGTEEVEVAILMQILHSLVAPPAALSVEAGMFHQTVLSIVARHLDRVVREVLAGLEGGSNINVSQSQKQQTMAFGQTILSTLRPHLDFARTGLAGHQELEMWSSPGNGIITTLRSTIMNLVLWSSSARNGTNGSLSTPHYLHSLVATSIEIFGPKVVVNALV
ncbi:mediator complex subunit Med5-domain-containing protein, partial [Peziza echinospora]